VGDNHLKNIIDCYLMGKLVLNNMECPKIFRTQGRGLDE
jgi:hypothetical protein